MWSSLALTGLTALVLAPNVHALGQKQCLILSSGKEGRHGHGHDGHRHRLDDQAVDQVVFGAHSNAHEDLIHGHEHNDHHLVIASKHAKHALPILLSSKSAPAVHIAARSFAEDIAKVTGFKPKLYNDTLPRHIEEAVVVGVAGEDGFDGEGDDGLKYVDELKGQWESFDVRAIKGVKGLKRALVIAGSNKVHLRHRHI